MILTTKLMPDLARFTTTLAFVMDTLDRSRGCPRPLGPVRGPVGMMSDSSMRMFGRRIDRANWLDPVDVTVLFD